MKKSCVIIDVEQNTNEWHELRAGRLTASKVNGLIGKTGKISDVQLKTRVLSMLEEIHAPEDMSDFSSKFMDRGHERESDAMDLVSFKLGLPLVEVGFCLDRELDIGCSPDAMSEDFQVGVEIKCPKFTTHARYLEDGGLPHEYMAQVYFSMYVTGVNKWIFCSYFPGLKPLILEVKMTPDMTEKFDEIVAKVNKKTLEFKNLMGV